MKRLTLIVMASLLVLGLAQCKKETYEGDPVSITLLLDTVLDNGNTKADIQPNVSGAVKYTEEDHVLVVYNGKFVGLLNYDGGAFTNHEIYIKKDGDDKPLYFYYLGNRQGDIEVGSTSCTVSLADQNSSYTVLSYSPSNEPFTGTGVYSARLKNQCGLVKFITQNIPDDIAVLGMKNQVTIDFAENTFTPSKNGDGHIFLNTPSGDDKTVRWAVLPIQDAVTNAKAFANDYVESATFSVPSVTRNMYYTEGVTVPEMEQLPPDIVNGTFTVGSSTPGVGTAVHFSRGNLQHFYNKIFAVVLHSDYYGGFSFTHNQYDYHGDGGVTSGNVLRPIWWLDGKPIDLGCTNSASPNAVLYQYRDLFGWGTSGYNGLFPGTISQDNNDYAFPNSSSDITDTDYDWGVYNKQSGQNKISNGGNYNWRTLSRTEWVNLIQRTKTISGQTVNLYAYATVMGVPGLLLLPDEWTGEVGGSTVSIVDNGSSASYNDNIFNTATSPTWEQMENAGVVFLPAAGYRDGNGVHSDGVLGPEAVGRYWTSTHGDLATMASDFRFTSSVCGSSSFLSGKSRGYSVRLVYNVGSGSGSTAAPTVTTTCPATNVSHFSATCAGEVVSDGGSPVTERGICWSSDHIPTIADNHVAATESGTGVFTCNLTGLTANTIYYFRAYATNGIGTSYGSECTFTTTGVTIDKLFSVGSGTKVEFSSGNLYYNGSNWGFESTPQEGQYVNGGYINVFNWGATGNTTNGGVDIYTFSEYTEGSYELSTYFGTDWGGVVGTLGGHDDWHTLTAEGWTYLISGRTNAANLYTNAMVGDIGGIILLPDNYYETGGPNVVVDHSNYNANVISLANWPQFAEYGAVFLPRAGYRNYNNNISNGSWGYYWSSSHSSESYSYARFFSHSNNSASVSENGMTRGVGCSVRLVRYVQGGPTLPTVTTAAASNVKRTSATCGGNVTSNGGATLRERGVCWSTSSNPTINDNHKKATTTATGSFQVSVSDLLSGTTYHVRAYASNSEGVAYGADMTFFTGHLFTVASGRTIEIAPGNLFYSSYNGGTWGFETSLNNGVYSNGSWTSLFNWGATGRGSGVDVFTTTDYVQGAGASLSNANGTDWGAVGTIDGHDDWRTITLREAAYLAYYPNPFGEGNRPNFQNLFGFGKVDGKYVFILLPDDWVCPEGLTFVPGGGSSAWDNNTYNYWDGQTMVDAGAVFLPASGYRDSGAATVYDKGDVILGTDDRTGYFGYYWWATGDMGTPGVSGPDATKAYYLWFGKGYSNHPEHNGNGNPGTTSWSFGFDVPSGLRSYGYSVRLGREVSR